MNDNFRSLGWEKISIHLFFLCKNKSVQKFFDSVKAGVGGGSVPKQF